MTETAIRLNLGESSGGLLQGIVSVIGGAGFTFALFLGIAYFERVGPVEAKEEIEDMIAVAMPPEAPPPKIVEQTELMPATVLPFAGIEIGATDSPVKIAVTPMDLEALLPSVDVPPVAAIQPALFHSDLKPKLSAEADFSRVFQASEVDKRPAVLSRTTPFVPRHVRGKAKVLKVSLLIVVDGGGSVTSIRVMATSGNPQFDTIIVDSVRTGWVFAPAMKQGRRVRCLLQQAVTVTWRRDGTPFES